jgi:adenosine kinase
LSAPFICQFFSKQLFEVLPFVDYLFGNESEALALGQTLELGMTDVAEIARHISQIPKIDGVEGRKVIFTQGALPTIVACKGEIEKFPVNEIPDKDILDTNGAGDAFVGGFLSQLVQERPLSACVSAGHYAASVIIRTLGVIFPARPNLTF